MVQSYLEAPDNDDEALDGLDAAEQGEEEVAEHDETVEGPIDFFFKIKFHWILVSWCGYING